MVKYISIGKAAKMLGVSIPTLRRWDSEDKLSPERTPSGHRRYLASDVAAFNPLGINNGALSRPAMAYARVPSHGQKSDLDRQIKVLEMHCASMGCKYEVISDLGSGMDYKKKGPADLLGRIVSDQAGRLIPTRKVRLLQFVAELAFAACEAKNVEAAVINHGDERSFEEELASGALEIAAVFSARMYGAGSHKNKKLIEGAAKSASDAENT
ncbi:MAG: IS607 family transposase [Clostridiales bacterium]|jgi:predicted site-specific integrase-resolvase|nr:IS607 family transposase [Clostridiales bacterium]